MTRCGCDAHFPVIVQVDATKLTMDANAGSPLTRKLSVASANGFEKDPYGDINKQQLISLLLQTLDDLGYKETSKTLEKESRISVDRKSVDKTSGDTLERFLASIKKGLFLEAVLLIPQLKLRTEIPGNFEIYGNGNLGLLSNKPFDVRSHSELDAVDLEKHIEFMLLKQKFLETLIVEKDSKEALNILKSEICNQDFNNLTEITVLSSLIVDERSRESYLTEHGFLKDDLEEAAKLSRKILIGRLLKYISSEQLLPPHRLASLLHQAKHYQQSKNLLTLDYQSENDKWSIFEDYVFPVTRFPSKVLQTLRYPKGQIWYVKFSHDGKYLAVCSEHALVVIYQVGDYGYEHPAGSPISSSNFKVYKILKGHTLNVLYCAWSPDNTKLLSSGFDDMAIMWDVKSGEIIRKISMISNKSGKKTDETKLPTIRAAMWLPNGRGFVLGSTEKELAYFNADGNEIYRWSGIRIFDLCISKDSRKLITISYSKFDVWDLITKKKIREVNIGRKVLSATISKSHNSQILINVVPDSIQLWDWHKGILVKKFLGQQQEEYVIRSCLGGGPNENLVFSGSEDGKVYVWNKKYAALILGLKAHEKLVNCVDSNPKIPWMIASGSDDKTVNIWGPEDALIHIRGSEPFGKEFDESLVAIKDEAKANKDGSDDSSEGGEEAYDVYEVEEDEDLDMIY